MFRLTTSDPPKIATNEPPIIISSLSLYVTCPKKYPMLIFSANFSGFSRTLRLGTANPPNLSTNETPKVISKVVICNMYQKVSMLLLMFEILQQLINGLIHCLLGFLMLDFLQQQYHQTFHWARNMENSKTQIRNCTRRTSKTFLLQGV